MGGRTDCSALCQIWARAPWRIYCIARPLAPAGSVVQRVHLSKRIHYSIRTADYIHGRLNEVSKSIRPPDIVVYILPGFFLSSSFFSAATLWARWTELNYNRPWSEVSAIWKRMSKSGVSPPPTKQGPKTPLFRWLHYSAPSWHLTWTKTKTSQLNGNFNGLYLRNETWCRQSAKCVDNYKGSSTSSQNDMNFGPQTASNCTAIFTHPMQILLSTSLPGFADGHQQT